MSAPSSTPIPDPAAIRARGISKTYLGDVVALAPLDIDLGPGTTTALIGHNGSGKTTLLRILAGVVAPDTGQVELLGGHGPAHSRRRSSVGYIEQDTALDPEMTGRDTLRLFGVLHGLSPRQSRVRATELAEVFDLAEHAQRPVATWSGGLRRRLHIAVGLVPRPGLVLLDEPTVGLDPDARDRLWEILAERVTAGCGVTIATHDLEEAARRCDRVGLLDRGRLVALDDPAALIARHGGPRLALCVDPAPRDPQALRLAIEALPGVRRCAVDRRQIWVSGEQLETNEPRVLALVDRHDLQALHVRHERAGLASVYFNLTGRGATPNDHAPTRRAHGTPPR